jgi:hypothetical protein
MELRTIEAAFCAAESLGGEIGSIISGGKVTTDTFRSYERTYGHRGIFGDPQRNLALPSSVRTACRKAKHRFFGLTAPLCSEIAAFLLIDATGNEFWQFSTRYCIKLRVARDRAAWWRSSAAAAAAAAGTRCTAQPRIVRQPLLAQPYALDKFDQDADQALHNFSLGSNKGLGRGGIGKNSLEAIA